MHVTEVLCVIYTIDFRLIVLVVKFYAVYVSEPGAKPVKPTGSITRPPPRKSEIFADIC